MKLALIQQNPTVGAIVANSALVTTAVSEARQAGADLAIFSELFLSGYPPKDLLRREGFVAACDRAVGQLAADRCRADWRADRPSDAARLARRPGRQCRAACCTAAKFARPSTRCCCRITTSSTNAVTSARRTTCAPIAFGGRDLGVHICEDAWWGEPDTFYHTDPEAFPDPVARLAEQGRRRADQRLGQSVRSRQAGAATATAAAARRRGIGVPFRVRQSGRRQRRSGVRRQQLRVQCGRAEVVDELAGFRDRLPVDRPGSVASRRAIAAVARPTAS